MRRKLLSERRCVVAAHQGRISLDSKLNEGSTFTVAVPAASLA
jgi:signal transduction histidine kinase